MILIFGTMPLAFAQTNTDTPANEPTIANVKPSALKPVAVSPTTATGIPQPTRTNVQSAPTVTAVSECSLSDELMKKYNQLLIELRKAESEGDKEKAEEITQEIISLKQAIAKAREECELKYPRPTVLPKPAAIATGTIDRCQLIENSELKYDYYKEIYSLPDEDIKKRGYLNREEVEKILKQLSDEIARIKIECGQKPITPVLECKSRICADGSTTTCETKTIEKCGVNTYSVSNQCDNAGTMFRNVYVECYDGIETMEGYAASCKSSLDWQTFAKDFCEGHCKKVETCLCSTCPELPTTTAIEIGKPIAIESGRPVKPNVTTIEYKPIVVGSGNEIKDYYKTRIEKITSLDYTDKQIKELKALKEEIDNLIEKLIKSKNTITTNDVSELVTKISVSAGEINADNVQIRTIGKKVLASINNKPISIEPTEKEVLIKDENLDVNAVAVSIQENVLRVGNSEVKLTASDVVDKLKITPKEIELMEENAKAVYKIKAEENRKLLGFIPIKIGNALTADAENGNVLEEQKPWYTFLTTG